MNVRLRDHRNALNRGQHVNIHLQRSWDKHGECVFTFNKLEVCSEDVLLEREQYHIDESPKEILFNIGAVGGGDNITNHPNHYGIVERITKATRERYNNMSKSEIDAIHSRPGESNANYGNKWSDEQREAASLTQTERMKDVLLREHLSNTTKQWWDNLPDDEKKKHGQNVSERQQGDGNSFFGKKHSDESREKISEWRKAHCANMTDEDVMNDPQTRPVIIDWVKYPSMSHAGRALGISTSHVRYRCRSHTKRWDQWTFMS